MIKIIFEDGALIECTNVAKIDIDESDLQKLVIRVQKEEVDDSIKLEKFDEEVGGYVRVDNSYVEDEERGDRSEITDCGGVDQDIFKND